MVSEFKYIDTHAHVNINAFAEDWREVMGQCAEENIAVINVGTQQDTSKKAVEIAMEADSRVSESSDSDDNPVVTERTKTVSSGYNGYAIVGLHPVHTSASYHDESELGENMRAFTSRGEIFDVDFYRELAKSSPKVVAIGECGYDYYRLEPDTKAIQEEAFIGQIELANELGLPLMIHTRDQKGNQASASFSRSNLEVGNVYDDTYETLKKYAKVPFNVHFYAGSWEQAKKFFDIGGTISFTGVITFAKDYEETVKNAPLELIHAETDCPYVAPVPHRGQRCEPWMVKEVYKKIAKLKGLDEEEVREQLLQNAKKLYKI